MTATDGKVCGSGVGGTKVERAEREREGKGRRARIRKRKGARRAAIEAGDFCILESALERARPDSPVPSLRRNGPAVQDLVFTV